MEDPWVCPAEGTPRRTPRYGCNPSGARPPVRVPATNAAHSSTCRFSWLLQELKLEYERDMQTSRWTTLARVQAELEKASSENRLSHVTSTIQKMRVQDVKDSGLVTPREIAPPFYGSISNSSLEAHIFATTPPSITDSSGKPNATGKKSPGPATPRADSHQSSASGEEQRLGRIESKTSFASQEQNLSRTVTPKSDSGGSEETSLRARFGPGSVKVEVNELALTKGWSFQPSFKNESSAASFARNGRRASVAVAQVIVKGGATGASESARQLRRFVKSQSFEVICAVAIILNVFVQAIAAELDAARKSSDSQINFDDFGVFFSVWFCTELLLRVWSRGWHFFVYGEEKEWNAFDVIVVFLDLGEKIVGLIMDRRGGVIQNLSAIRVLRILRIVRIIAFIRKYRFFKDLRMMVFSLLRSATALFWSIVLFNVCVFVFSIYLMKNVTSMLDTSHVIDPDTVEKLKDMFGTVRKAQFTLYKTVSGGVDWGEVADPLMEAHWFNGWVLCFYVFFTLLGVMNIITGIFVDRAIQSASNDRDEVITQQLEERHAMLRELQQIFEATDEDGNGTISLAEFEAQIQDETMAMSFARIGLEINEARGLFRLLDISGSGEVGIQDFICGCMRLKGTAKSVDLATFMYENKRVVQQLQTVHTSVQEGFQGLQDLQEHMKGRLESLVSISTKHRV